MAPTVGLAEYLFTRLRQLGVEAIHGVPGDYNLSLLDYVEPQGLYWVGNCNELNAGYAADGYARVKGLGALITTFGVGELSAVNAIAGAYAELVPVVHIVGTPTRHQQDSRALIHHTLNDGEYRHFARMYAHITAAQADLLDPRTAPQLIDTTLQQCLLQSRPVYIQLPVDMVAIQIPADQLSTPVRLPPHPRSPNQELAVADILERMYQSKRPMILVDGESHAYGILSELHQLCTQTEWPIWSTVFGKSYIDETLRTFHGIWKGSAAHPHDAEYVNSADLILCFGPHFSGTNSYYHSSIPKSEVTILFTSNAVQTPKTKYRDVPAKSILTELVEKLVLEKLQPIAKPFISSIYTEEFIIPKPTDAVKQDLFYKQFGCHLYPGDVILAETGTAGFGSRDFRLPPMARLFKPSTWLSIGYMLPAAQGAALAQKQLHEAGKWHSDGGCGLPRTILLIGDGSFQMTAQEVSTIIREKLNVTILLINNDGYTIERCIHGRDQKYNDVARWRYLQAPSFFGAPENSDDSKDAYSAETFEIRTYGDLEKHFGGKPIEKAMFRMAEIFMDREDAPGILAALLKRQDISSA